MLFFFQKLIFVVTSIVFFLLSIHANPLNWDASKISYPKARRSNVTFSYPSLKANGNVSVPDPYNYMEQGYEKSKETKTFVDAENALTKSYLDKNEDLQAILDSIGNLNNYSGLALPQAFGPDNNKQYLYKILETGKPKSTWYIASESQMKEAYKNQFATYPGKKWFDENLLTKNGSDQLDKMYVSPDGKLVTYTLTVGGTGFQTIFTREISSPFITESPTYVKGGAGALPEVLPYGDGGDVFWTADSKGFFYTQWLYPNGDPVHGQGSQIRYHVIGTAYEKDVIVAGQPNQIFAFWGITMTGDMKWLIANMNMGVDFHSTVYVASLDQPISSSMKWQSIAPKIEHVWSYYASIGTTFYFATDIDGALNYKVVSVEIDPTKARPVVKDFTELTEELPTKTIIPENPDGAIYLLDADLTPVIPSFDNDKIMIWYTEKGKHVINVYDLNTGKKLAEVLPQGHGTVEFLSCSQSSNEVFLATSTMNKPNTIYRIVWKSDKKTSSGFLQVQMIADQKIQGVDLDSIVSEQHFSTSKDGTKIPFTAFYKKGTKFDGTHPAWLYFYGQYGLVYLPEYRSQFVDFILNYDGIVLWANPRGGGEGGTKWHLEGELQYRQNTVDDVISVAQYATDNKYAAPGLIVIDGGSAAGCTCMVVTNQAPEGLIGASLCRKGDYDQLRSVTLDQNTGPANVPEFGNPFNATDFDWMVKYSPLDNVNKNKKYGAVLLFTTVNDERVNPAHALKMIATLQYDLPKNPYPILLYFASQGGHLADHSSRDFNVETLSNNLAIITQSIDLKRNKERKRNHRKT